MQRDISHNPELALALLGDDHQDGMEPCPHCGGKSLWPEVSWDEFDYGIYCADCGCVGPRASASDDPPDAAVAAWNREARQVREARGLGLTVNLEFVKLDQPRKQAHG